MALDPVLAGLIAAAAAAGDQTTAQPVVPDVITARLNYENDAQNMTPMAQRDPVADVYDLTLPGPDGSIAVRVYRPLSAPAQAPVIVWFHGGGWMIGSLDTGDTVARALCNGADAVVMSVDYRLAPEHPWPAGLDDATAALRWVAQHASKHGGDPARIAVGGDSAGGNLAAVVAQRARSAGPALIGQVLIYPATDLDAARSGLYPSMQENASGYVLTTEAVQQCVAIYLPSGADPADARISPCRCQELTGLPSAVVAVAENDPLRDQGIAYAASLREARVPVVEHAGSGLIHGSFDMLGTVPASRNEFDRIATSVRQLLSSEDDRFVNDRKARQT